ncbi:MAG: hypothetical protein A49_12410 [Methyloceanibacter sp.]|nr:MAG: hypothetical protein A49_12410 [Methyloceanibacter sp.]
MKRETEIVHGLGLKHDILAFDRHPAARAIGMGLQLLLHQHPQRRAVPIVRDEQVVRHADGM